MPLFIKFVTFCYISIIIITILSKNIIFSAGNAYNLLTQ